MDQLMNINGMWVEMAVEQISWSNGNAPSRPTRVGVQTRAYLSFRSSVMHVGWVLVHTVPTDLGLFSDPQG